MAIISGKDTYWTAKRGIVQNGLVLNLDAAVASSYPGTGTTWYDLSGNGNNGIAMNIVPTTNRANDPNSAYQFQSAAQIDVLKVDPVNVAGSTTTTTSTLLA